MVFYNQQNNFGFYSSEVNRSIIMNNNNDDLNLIKLNKNGIILSHHQLQQFEHAGNWTDLSSTDSSSNLIENSQFHGVSPFQTANNLYSEETGSSSTDSYTKPTLEDMHDPLHSDPKSSEAIYIPKMMQGTTDLPTIEEMKYNLNFIQDYHRPRVSPVYVNVTTDATKNMNAAFQYVVRKHIEPLYKNDHEYSIKRAKNNKAVRKSREKAKARMLETHEKVKFLMDENKELSKKIQSLNEEKAVMLSFINSNRQGEAFEFYRKEFHERS